ncbi:succinate dehydrogenase-ubiquinone-cytochrome b small subunit, mitochondrial precursor [Mollisia scopiformis]|uniref:Succinate dehydrogenase [ubiquinone] cytochrome b small subunit n=1 Tax=Mollisia scopiformis TaxID=149040 RepID=A0A194XW49_MOLSC|nr:succinate dehydrogenase-ubiquinone-cytochrome b small subunit, mitochondrial precursor [Mollisia scopiformis]KUJ24239.1 succinate dehydrogenase-ubiquinone-cytochrome b small subunit, mitochondrial precursor [Mollisia scopiformis]
MTSIVRPAMLQKTCFAAASRRAFSTKLSSNPATNPTSVLSRKVVRNTFARDAVPGSMRVAAFHASGRRSLLPALPQVVQGTANDPAPVPTPSPSHGSYHWTFERLISAGLVPLTIAPFAAGSLNPMMDAILCGTILIHSHIGFESIVIDYIPTKRLPKTRVLFWWGLRAATVLVGVGLYEFETNDVGVTEAIKRIWKA